MVALCDRLCRDLLCVRIGQPPDSLLQWNTWTLCVNWGPDTFRVRTAPYLFPSGHSWTIVIVRTVNQIQKVFAKNRRQTFDLLWNVNKMEGKNNCVVDYMLLSCLTHNFVPPHTCVRNLTLLYNEICFRFVSNIAARIISCQALNNQCIFRGISGHSFSINPGLGLQSSREVFPKKKHFNKSRLTEETQRASMIRSRLSHTFTDPSIYM